MVKYFLLSVVLVCGVLVYLQVLVGPGCRHMNGVFLARRQSHRIGRWPRSPREQGVESIFIRLKKKFWLSRDIWPNKWDACDDACLLSKDLVLRLSVWAYIPPDSQFGCSFHSLMIFLLTMFVPQLRGQRAFFIRSLRIYFHANVKWQCFWDTFEQHKAIHNIIEYQIW